MFKSLLASAGLAVVALLFASSASAQPPLQIGPGESLVPGSFRDAYGRPIPDPTPRRQDTGWQTNGDYYNPSTGGIDRDERRELTKPSAYDPNRHIIDPGSFHNVDEYKYDPKNGLTWHITGTMWTSLGTPHSNLTRTASRPRNSGRAATGPGPVGRGQINYIGMTTVTGDQRGRTNFRDDVAAAPAVPPSNGNTEVYSVTGPDGQITYKHRVRTMHRPSVSMPQNPPRQTQPSPTAPQQSDILSNFE